MTGNPKRDWFFSTPPIPRQRSDFYEGVLGVVTPQACFGDIIGGSSNLALWSEQIDNGVWSPQQATIGANLTSAPDGTTTGDKLQETAVTNIHRVTQVITVASVQQTFSVWVRQGERTKAVLVMSDAATGEASIGIDLSNGTTFASGIAVGSWTGISATVESGFFNFWYRVTLTATRGAGTQTHFGVHTWDTAISFLGVAGSGVYVWGAQLELAAAATSYTRTTSAAVNTLSGNYCSEIVGWTPVRIGTGHYVVLDFVLHEA